MKKVLTVLMLVPLVIGCSTELEIHDSISEEDQAVYHPLPIAKYKDGYYIQDLDTTNGTYVNDIRVMPGRYMKLDPGNIIRLAEEEFEYKG